MQIVKSLGQILDDNELLELPIIAQETGKHTIIITHSLGSQTQRLCFAEQEKALTLPNTEDKKSLEHGINLIEIIKPSGVLLKIEDATKFEVTFIKNTKLHDSSLIHQITEASEIWKLDNPNQLSYSIYPNNPENVRIDFSDKSTATKVIIDWKFIPRTGFIILH